MTLMGCPDWMGMDNCMIMGIQMMWFGTVVLLQVIPLIHALEDKVSPPIFAVLLSKMIDNSPRCECQISTFSPFKNS